MHFFENMINSGLKKRYAAFFILAVIGLVIYSNTFRAPFAFDDQRLIEENFRIQSLRNFFTISGDRYFAELSFALNFAAGRLNTFGYHLVNIFIHIFNAIFVYLLAVLTIKTSFVNKVWKYNELEGQAEYIAFAAALIFLTHPIQTQAVTYLSQRCASLAVFFYLSSLILYIKTRLAALEGQSSLKQWVFYIGSVFLAVAAQKTKEISFTLPIIITLYEFTFFNKSEGVLKRIVRLLPLLLTLLIIPLSRLSFSIAATPAVNAGLIGKLDSMTKESAYTLSRYDYFVTQIRVVVTYLRLLVFPANQSIDYDYPKFHSFFTPEVFLSSFFLIALFVSAVYLYLRSMKKSDFYGVFIALGILWFFITLSVESSVIPIVDVMFEHRLYLPGIGLMFSFSAFLFYTLAVAKGRYGLKSVIPAVIVVIALIGSFLTFTRNTVWKDGETLWRDVAMKSPNNARAYNNLGYELYRKGKAGEAAGYLETSIRLQPNYETAYLNLSDVFLLMRRFDEAAEQIKTVLRHNPNSYRANFKMGNVMSQMGRYNEAEEYYNMAIKIDPVYPDTYINLANSLVPLNRVDDAIRLYEKALIISPDNAYAKKNLAMVLRMKMRNGLRVN